MLQEAGIDACGASGFVSVIEKYVGQGTTVFVQGMPLIEEYEKDGQKQRSFKIKLAGAGSTFRMGGKSGGDAAPQAQPKAPDEDIPF